MFKYLVEFLGTALLCFIVLIASGPFAGIAIGATLAIAILIGGKVSGGAFNPAVAIAMFSAGKLRKMDLIPYIVAEILGGLFAFLIVKKLLKK